MKKLSACLISFLTVLAFVGCQKPSPDSEPKPDPKPESGYDYDIEPIITQGLYMVDPVEFAGLANYYIMLSEVQIPSGQTYTEEGSVVGLDLYAKPSADMLLPAGRYNLIGESEELGEMTASYYSLLRVVGSDLQATSYEFSEATVDVTVAGRIITITLLAKTTEGKTVHCQYSGEIPMFDISEPDVDESFPPLLHNVETTFTGAKASYHGLNDKNAGFFKITLADYDMSDPYALGADVWIELYSDMASGTKLPAVGTYSVGSEGKIATYHPGLINALQQDRGTRSIVVEKENGESVMRYGFVDGGTITVAKAGDQFTITVDLTTAKGKTIKGTYQGALEVTDKSYVSTLTEDKTVDLSAIPCKATLYGQVYQEIGVDAQVWMLAIAPEQGPDGAQITILTPAAGTFEQGLPVGTYPLGFDYPSNGYLCMPGEMDAGGSLYGSWYVGEIEGGYVAQLAPFVAGEITITKVDAQYTIHCVVTDDAPSQNTLDITWKGVPTTSQTKSAPDAIPAMLKTKAQRQAVVAPEFGRSSSRSIKAHRIAKFNSSPLGKLVRTR